MLRWILTAILLFTWATHAAAVEIVGQIGAVEEKGVAVLVVGEITPQVGDKFTVVIDVPGVGEARIAQGQVNALDSGIALGTITEATGKLVVGQKVKIDSPQSVPMSGDNTARTLSGWGEVVNPGGDCRFERAGDRLTITTPGTPTPHDLDPRPEYDNVLGPRVLREMVGDFQLQVKVRAFPLPEASTFTGKNVKVSYVSAGLLVWVDDKTFIKFQRAANGEAGNAWVHLQGYVDGVKIAIALAPGDVRKVAVDQDTYLRVERVDDMLTFYAGVDGKEWNEIGRVGALGLPRKLRAGVGVVNATKVDFAPEFEDLKKSGGT